MNYGFRLAESPHGPSMNKSSEGQGARQTVRGKDHPTRCSSGFRNSGSKGSKSNTMLRMS